MVETFPQAGQNQFEFDLAMYRLSAIKKAAYQFSGDFTVTIEVASDKKISVRLAPKANKSTSRMSPQEFPQEVLDQELREAVAEETKSIRDLLLAHTFSGLALTDPQGEAADYHDDPLGIAGRPSKT